MTNANQRRRGAQRVGGVKSEHMLWEKIAALVRKRQVPRVSGQAGAAQAAQGGAGDARHQPASGPSGGPSGGGAEGRGSCAARTAVPGVLSPLSVTVCSACLRSCRVHGALRSRRRPHAPLSPPLSWCPFPLPPSPGRGWTPSVSHGPSGVLGTRAGGRGGEDDAAAVAAQGAGSGGRQPSGVWGQSRGSLGEVCPGETRACGSPRDRGVRGDAWGRHVERGGGTGRCR